MGKTKKLLIVGAGELAEIAYEYFTYDSRYEAIGFGARGLVLDDYEITLK